VLLPVLQTFAAQTSRHTGARTFVAQEDTPVKTDTPATTTRGTPLPGALTAAPCSAASSPMQTPSLCSVPAWTYVPSYPGVNDAIHEATHDSEARQS